MTLGGVFLFWPSTEGPCTVTSCALDARQPLSCIAVLRDSNTACRLYITRNCASVAGLNIHTTNVSYTCVASVRNSETTCGVCGDSVVEFDPYNAVILVAFGSFAAFTGFVILSASVVARQPRR